MTLRLAYKFALSIGGLLLAAAALGSILSFQEAREASLIALERQGDAVATTLSYAFEVLLDDEELTSLQRIATNSILLPNVREIIAVDLGGKVIASGERVEVGKPVRSPYLRAFLEEGAVKPLTRETEDSGLVVLRPLLRGKYSSALDTGVVGAVQITMDRREIEAQAFAVALQQLGIHAGSYVLLAALLALVLRGLVVSPLDRLAEAARRIRGGDRSRRSKIASRDEIGVVSRVFDEMADEVERTVSSLEEQVKARTADLSREVEARTAALDDLCRAHDELKASAEERLRLVDAVRELSTPVIRAYRDVVIVPLVGAVDADRARQVEASLLAGIARHKARVVILDLTGVPFVDTHVVAALFRAARSAELLGARVVFAGMSPKIAMSLVSLEADLSGVVAHANLEKALFSVGRGLGQKARRRARCAT